MTGNGKRKARRLCRGSQGLLRAVRATGARRTLGALVPSGVLAALVALALPGCGRLESTRDVRVTILDEAGNPLPGAVFYVEAYDDDGPFAFLAARAGDAGEVPDQAREPLKLPWRRGAHLALAAFAPGRRSAVHRDPGRRLESDGVVLTLVAAATPAEEWQPAVAKLGFPFAGDSALAAKAGRPEFAFLREAFARAEAFRPGAGGPAAGGAEARGGVQESATKRRDPQTSTNEAE